MTKSQYLTARCSDGCEAWLHPAAMAAHHDRCRGYPWVDDIPDTVLVTAQMREVFAAVLPEALLDYPHISADRLLRRGPMPGGYIRPEVANGLQVRSPIETVSSSRWVLVAIAIVRQYGDGALRQALDPERFADLERELVDPATVVECKDCGHCSTTRGAAQHRAANTACRWRRSFSEVRSRWEQGWRDPWSVSGAPLKWSELRDHAPWRGRLATVMFPRWVAVMLASDHAHHREAGGEPDPGRATARGRRRVRQSGFGLRYLPSCGG